MEDPRIQELLDKYAANTCTPGETDELHRWYDAFRQEGVFTAGAGTGEAMKAAVFAAIGVEAAPPVRKRYLWRWTAAAAVAVLALGTWWLLENKPPAPVAMVEIVAPAGDSIRTVEFPDGSRAWLAPGSRIRYRQGFDDGNRKVELPDGQVIFETGKATEHPFTVVTGKGVEVKVLGTVFTITSYKELAETDVHVTSGAVQVSDSTGMVEVLRAQEGISYIVGAPVKKQQQPAPDFRNGQYTLRDAGMPYLAAYIKRKYGVTVAYDAQELKDIRFNIFIDKELTPAEFFNLLKTLGGLDYELSGNTVRFFTS